MTALTKLEHTPQFWEWYFDTKPLSGKFPWCRCARMSFYPVNVKELQPIYVPFQKFLTNILYGPSNAPI